MSPLKKGLAFAVVALAAFFLLRKSGVVPGGTAKIEGARYAAAIPVFPGARLEDEGGGNYYNEIGGPVTFTSHTWFFTTDKTPAEVVAWYRQQLPAGARLEEAEPAGEGGGEDEEGEEGGELEEVEEAETVWTWVPPGAREGEDVTIRVKSDGFSVSETVKAGS